MELHTTSGNVTLDACDTSLLDCTVKSGNFFAEFLTGKVYDIKTNSGTVSVPENGDGGSCHVETFSGDITSRTIHR